MKTGRGYNEKATAKKAINKEIVKMRQNNQKSKCKRAKVKREIKIAN